MRGMLYSASCRVSSSLLLNTTLAGDPWIQSASDRVGSGGRMVYLEEIRSGDTVTVLFLQATIETRKAPSILRYNTLAVPEFTTLVSIVVILLTGRVDREPDYQCKAYVCTCCVSLLQ